MNIFKILTRFPQTISYVFVMLLFVSKTRVTKVILYEGSHYSQVETKLLREKLFKEVSRSCSSTADVYMLRWDVKTIFQIS